jgi:hypothetical protein
MALAGFDPVTFGSSGKHTNHYTTEATDVTLVLVLMIGISVSVVSLSTGQGKVN